MPGPVTLADGAVLRPLSSRSAVLSALLGSDAGSLRPADLVALGAEVGFGENAVRASLSRMVTAGELHRDEDGYRLNARLVERQRRQEEAVRLHAEESPWDGTWLVAVVTASGREAGERSALRAGLRAQRLAELREGVWLRPANLDCELGRFREVSVLRHARPDEDEAELVARLWDLPGWSRRAQALLDAAETRDGADGSAERFTVMAGIVRHLLDDPLLPPALVGPGHLGARLRETYADYRTELGRLREALATR